MKNYSMLVKIPIVDTPDDITIQEAKVTSDIWLKGKIPDAIVIEFSEVSDD